MHEVAITGIGIVSCLGTGVRKVTESLRLGRSGVRVDAKRKELGFRGVLTGCISDFTPPPLDRKLRRTTTDFGLQAYGAALQAIEMAGWSDGDVRSPATGLILGNDTSTAANARQIETVKQEQSTFSLGASQVFQSLNSTVTMNLNAILGNLGACWTVSGACASGGHAVGQAADLIACGRQDRMLCGGVQEINWESVASFDATNAFSVREESPEEASRPFDAARDGLVPSGGAAVVALERADSARARGVVVLGHVLSYSFSADGRDLAVPTGEGLRRCMEDCLGRGGVRADDVDYVCAHGTSTPLGDAAEARAIASVFGRPGPWVSSVKSMTGHEMWMAGAAQVVYTAIMGQARFIAPNINFTRQEDEAAKVRIAAETIDRAPRHTLCNSAGFGGTNSCILIRMDSAGNEL
ncbi:MAG: beta-ketoacyl-[acyl-carrier-protein] synthase family protein [Phycisphaerae bacterium]